MVVAAGSRELFGRVSRKNTHSPSRALVHLVSTTRIISAETCNGVVDVVDAIVRRSVSRSRLTNCGRDAGVRGIRMKFLEL